MTRTINGSIFPPFALFQCEQRQHQNNESAIKDDDFVAEANAAFQVLVDALIEQQNAGGIRKDDPVQMARFVWAVVRGTAMLGH
jgi:hypothetical protein